MQTASTTFVPPPQNGYQPLSAAEIYAVKRQYLALLPPQQIIDICLTFEAHAPIHVKSSVWPYDIRAAIASILAQKTQAAETQTSPDPDLSKASAPHPESSSGEKTAQPQAGSSQQPTAAPTQSASTAGSISQPATSPIPPATLAPHYPHQPYYHPAYPHASYYTTPHPTYGYPHPYPSYPPPPALYPVNHASQHPPMFTNTPLVHPPHPTQEPPPPLNNIDDLPSYEEMIVEALLDSGDPEGCAPKSLFGWMATHYPLQTNFRPSASQALQKAYRRGRLEKGTNGKYRLNENWEGGNTTKRTTRRPQILAQTTLTGTQPSSSPFTHTPLVSHGATSLPTRPPPPGLPPGYGYPFGYPYQGMPGSAHASAASSATSQRQSANIVDHELGEGSDAWEAAQNILKAINFGQLFQLSDEENKAGEPSTSVQPMNQQASADGSDQSSARGAAIPAESVVEKSTELNAEQRAALQAQLALLAAQLAELADVSEDELSHNLEVPMRTTAASDARTPLIQGEEPDDDEHNEDMMEIPVPLASLTA